MNDLEYGSTIQVRWPADQIANEAARKRHRELRAELDREAERLERELAAGISSVERVFPLPPIKREGGPFMELE